MPLDLLQVRRLVAMVGETEAHEIHCDECLSGMAQFAELELVGRSIPAALGRIRRHLETCLECAEEYRTLLELLSDPDPVEP